MKLKELQQLIPGVVTLYEESEIEYEYNDLFIGDSADIPEAMLEREIVMISVSASGDMLDIKLKKQCKEEKS